MAKTTKDVERQVKARQTKLSKKSNEELIDIILRKDKTEKSLNAQIVTLKSEVNALTSRVNNFDKDQESNIKAINHWKSLYDGKCEFVDRLNSKLRSLIKDVEGYETRYEALYAKYHKRVKQVNKYKLICWLLGIGFAFSLFV